jgi:hypothetical protein
MNHRDAEMRKGRANAWLISCVFAALGFVQFAGATRAWAQEPPLAGRPPQFSGIVGLYAIRVSAAPLEAPVEEPITLRVTIEGRGPAKYHPDRKQLKLFPESWSRNFYVEAVPQDDRLQPEEGRWEFVYRLRPKHQGVKAIDGIKLVYYAPQAGKYQTRYADAIAIEVKPPRAAPAVADNLPVRTAPASFYAMPTGDEMLTEPPRAWTVPGWLWLILLLAPPVATVAGVRMWSACFAGRARRVWQQSGAARAALDELAAPNGTPVWVVLTAYLHERLRFPAEEATPADVRRYLRRHDASRAVADQLAGFLGSCDAARFAGSAGAGPERDAAARLIGALEDDLCDS